ncbi:penicillin acylase family protein [Methylomagnum ishizawai]|uniref:penicillin acylase family protein n=1 Tax=Methylomagnum ishizawai TaxID=1760988 RepID=UPI001C33A4CA|nr:penicillin acylase family protein [Methylomagnum ishizawai]BBL77211.1 penicillin amidase [Methylomagnum ishizawai]
MKLGKPLIYLGLLVAGWALFQGYRSRPEDAAPLPGLDRPVEIIRDRQGVPHIYADTEADAYFALGYVHAQDRLWQMDLNRRLGSGRLAEVLGEKALEQDRFMRTLGLRRAAERNLEGLDAGTRRILDAYARGVNAYVGRGGRLPLEFWVQGYRPTPWTPVDSLVWLKTLAWNLSGNWWEELLNLRLSRRLPPERIAELFPPYPGDTAFRLPALDSLYAGLDASAQALMALDIQGPRRSLGSNNWAVDGHRSRGGQPLLANDPHLKLGAPPVWYFAHLEAPGLSVVGATLPGVPAVVLGRSRHAAWAFTNTGPDTQDIYVEKPLAGDASRYLTPDGTAAFGRISETIGVRGAAPETLVVRTTRHGPVISDASPEVRAALPAGTAMALRWTGLDPEDTTLRFMHQAARARDGDGILAAARDFQAPQQNIVYADDRGGIGFVAAGRIPIRRSDNDLMGLAPAPGWDARYDWTGFIPFGELPQSRQPASGKIVTANQKITPPDYPYWITSGWLPPYRARRIDALLDATAHHDVASFAAIQTDAVNPVALQLLPHLLRVKAQDPEQRRILARLRAWDGDMAKDRAEPLIFAEWIRRLSEVLYRDALGDLYEAVGDYNPLFLANLLGGEGASHWCPDPARDGDPPCAAALGRALALALDGLKQRYGADPDRWTWGRAHSARSLHHPYGGLPLLSWLFNVEVPSPGGMDTINVSGYAYDESSGRYVGEAGPSFRALYDLADPDRSLFVLSAGQSGDPLSPHYRDMAEPWAGGRYLPLVMDRDRIVKDAESTLRLEPG